jgi:hypothetical protein
MTVKIIKSSENSYWYMDDIGKEFDIKVDSFGNPDIYNEIFYQIKDDEYLLVLIDDCIILK